MESNPDGSRHARIPLAGWVWNMNVEVAELRNDLGDAEEVIADLEKDIRLGRQRETNHWNRKGHRVHEELPQSDRADGDEMSALLFMTLLNSPLEEPIDDLKRDTKALELYLQDKEDTEALSKMEMSSHL